MTCTEFTIFPSQNIFKFHTQPLLPFGPSFSVIIISNCACCAQGGIRRRILKFSLRLSSQVQLVQGDRSLPLKKFLCVTVNSPPKSDKGTLSKCKVSFAGLLHLSFFPARFSSLNYNLRPEGSWQLGVE